MLRRGLQASPKKRSIPSEVQSSIRSGRHQKADRSNADEVAKQFSVMFTSERVNALASSSAFESYLVTLIRPAARCLGPSII